MFLYSILSNYFCSINLQKAYFSYMQLIANRLFRNLILSLALSASLATFGQSELSTVNFELIPYKTVQAYIHQMENNLVSFLDIKPSWTGNAEGYNSQSKTYKIKGSINDVWAKYKETSPTESWNGKKVMFGFMYSKNQKKPVYGGDNVSQIKPGQVIFLNLKLLKFYNLAMAFEVLAVDDAKKIIEFSYIEGNASQGKQTLQFVDTEDGNTEIIHSSYFKSDSKLRDKIYPFFHTRTTNEFHRIMKKLICSN